MADGFSIVWDGLKAFEEALARISTEADAAAKEIVTRGAAIIEAAAKANFSGSHKRGEPHVGGSRPNVVSGTLRRSIRHDPVTRFGLADYGTRAYPSTVYARRIELGYRGSGAYPYFTPAVRDVQPELTALATATWTRFLR